MMGSKYPLVALGLLTLAACSGNGGGNDSAASSSETAAGKGGSSAGTAMAEIRLDPGQWETSHEIVSMESPNMPKEMMKAMAGKVTTIKTCITPEQAAKPNADFFADRKNGCAYKDFAMAGGRISGTLTCTSKEGPGAMTMKMDGRYARDSYEMAVEMTTDANAGAMTIKSRGSGRRLGACPPGGAE